jgi:hypothetical protein
MILSLQINYQESLDVFSFFKVEHAIICPYDLWFHCLCASLRMKHSVLLLEKSFAELPLWDSKQRWQTGDNWCWLAPRSLKAISCTYSKTPQNLHQFRNSLNLSK